MVPVNPALVECNLLWARHHQALARLNGLDELGRLQQGIVCASVQPGHAAPEFFQVKLSPVHVQTIEIGDFQFAARAGAQHLGQLNHAPVIEVQARHRIVAARLLGFLLDAEHASLTVQLGHAIGLGILHEVAKHGGPGLATGHVFEQAAQPRAVEDVVAQHQGAGIAGDEPATDEKSLGQPVGAGLHGVLNLQTPGRAIAQKLLKLGRVVRRGDDQDPANSRQHQSRERVVDERLVVHRHELLAHRTRERVQARARSSGQDDSLLHHGQRLP